MNQDDYKQPTTPGGGNDHGQKPPSDSNQVRQRHQIGEPEKQDSVPVKKAP